MAEKPLCWLGSSLDDVRAFPDDACREAGYELGRVQEGLMPTVGLGAYEIRVHTRLGHRVFYVAKFEEAIYVLHAFEKRTRQTPQAEITVARKRLAELLARRMRNRETP